MGARDPETGQFVSSSGMDFQGLNVATVNVGATWSPEDDNATKSTSAHDPADVPAGGGIAFEYDGVEVPEDHLLVGYGFELLAGDFFDVAFLPGTSSEHWIYKGDGALGLGDSDWIDRTRRDDFLTYMAVGYNGIEDTASGTGGSTLWASPPDQRWTPPRPFLSATGEFSGVWEGDGENPPQNNGEFAIRLYYDLMEAPRDEIIQELLQER